MAKRVLVLLLVALIGGSAVSSWAQGTGDDGSSDTIDGKFNGATVSPPTPPASYALTVKHYWDARPGGGYCGPSSLPYAVSLTTNFADNANGQVVQQVAATVRSARPPDDCQDLQRGTWSYGPGGAGTNVDLTATNFATFGLGSYQINVYYNNQQSPCYTSGAAPGVSSVSDTVVSNAAAGVSVIEVQMLSGTTASPASSGNVIFNGSGDTVTVPLKVRTVAGKSYSYVIFGNNVDGNHGPLTNGVVCDARYPEGMLSGTYTLSVSIPGHPAQLISKSGQQWVGSGALVSFSASGGSDTTAGNTNNDNGTGLNGTNAGASAPPSAGGGTFDATGFLASLKQMLIDLIAPSADDITALKTATDKIWTWGPLSLPSQLASAYADTFGAVQVQLASHSPNYWIFDLNACSPAYGLDNGNGVNTAAGDDNNTAPCGPDTSSAWLSFFPQTYDFRGYVYYLQLARKISLGLGWIVFLILCLQRANPKVQV